MKLMIRFGALLIAGTAIFSSCGSSDSPKVSDEKSTETTEAIELSSADIYEQRVSQLSTMLGMTESELVGYSITCGIDLSDVSKPFSYVTSVLLPVLTSDQLNEQMTDTMNGIDKARCLYAQ